MHAAFSVPRTPCDSVFRLVVLVEGGSCCWGWERLLLPAHRALLS